MAGARATEPRERSTVVAEFEGALLKNIDTFPYFMLVAFEASSVISFVRFVVLLLLWPLVWLLGQLGARDVRLKMMIFVSTAWVKAEEVEWVARAVLPKFYMDDLDLDAWKVFDAYDRKLVVTSCPRVMVEMFAKEHLGAHEVIGGELEVNRLGYATGFLCKPKESICKRVKEVVGTEEVEMGLVGRTMMVGSFLPLCKDHLYPPFSNHHHIMKSQLDHPPPVVFHDGRLVPHPTPTMSLLILLWLPFGILVAFVRILVGLIVPMSFILYTIRFFGGRLTIHGPLPSPSPTGTLFVCTHRTLMDPVILSMVLARQVPAVTYSISRISELLSPIPTIPLSRNRLVDAERIREHLSQGDLVVCPEGTTCREPFLLRFSALFAELTDRIVPVAMNYRVGFFHATTARGWKGLDPIFFMMNPRPEYEVTFLSQLSVEATVTGGRKPEDVANYVQRMLATTLGFECTEFTRRDKYKVLAGNDGIVASPEQSTIVTMIEHAMKVVLGLWKACKV